MFKASDIGYLALRPDLGLDIWILDTHLDFQSAIFRIAEYLGLSDIRLDNIRQPDIRYNSNNYTDLKPKWLRIVLETLKKCVPEFNYQ